MGCFVSCAFSSCQSLDWPVVICLLLDHSFLFYFYPFQLVPKFSSCFSAIYLENFASMFTIPSTPLPDFQSCSTCRGQLDIYTCFVCHSEQHIQRNSLSELHSDTEQRSPEEMPVGFPHSPSRSQFLLGQYSILEVGKSFFSAQ